MRDGIYIYIYGRQFISFGLTWIGWVRLWGNISPWGIPWIIIPSAYHYLRYHYYISYRNSTANWTYFKKLLWWSDISSWVIDIYHIYDIRAIGNILHYSFLFNTLKPILEYCTLVGIALFEAAAKVATWALVD